MAFFEFKNVRIAGIAAGVPRNVASNLHPTEQDVVSSEYSPEDFVKTTGVLERRVSRELTTSDLSYAAAERLIHELGWNKEEIGVLIFVSQTHDFILPATACILQDRLGLSKECYATDLALGCSGWVYGLSTVASLLGNGNVKKALMLCGDAKKRWTIEGNLHRDPLFGSAGTATALEYCETASSLQFHFGTDGDGYDAIIVPDGGSRSPFSKESFQFEEFEGKQVCRLMTHMKGMDVFSFGISTAPKSVKALASYFGFDYLEADFYVFHQANMKMNNMIVKKLKLPEEKVPSCMLHFGNTSSASIPLTIVTQLKGKCENRKRFVCCGFGVGLSWGTVAFTTDNLVMPTLVEVADDEIDTIHVV